MLTSSKTLAKLRRVEQIYNERVYEPVQLLECEYFETREHLRAVPGASADWTPCPAGTAWGEAWGSAWFRAAAEIPAEYGGQPLYLVARTGAVEALFWLDGRPAGIFNYDPFIKIRGDHRAQLIADIPNPGKVYDLVVEGYAGHPTVGSQPMDRIETQPFYPYPFRRTFNRFELCHRNTEINDFVLDLRTLNQLSSNLPAESFRKGAVDAALTRVFETVYQDPENADRELWLPALTRARQIMKPLLDCRNGDSAPFAGLVGHSHLDTAWHWTIDEGIRKCARTCSNALRLMEQYPEYRFIQSSAFHIELMRRHYPDVFAGIKQRIAEGRWEPNSGVWIEPDANLAGGEALVRHFLFGQRYTAEHFNYRSDTFWLPDTFGFSAALPQILRGCDIKFFLTTKLTWNETNVFPYDTFWWEGIDGSRVFTHFNDIHCAPDPETLINKLYGTGPKDFRVVQNCVRHKDVNNRRLISYGYGDGGGGPDAQMIEIARRCRDLEGCPRAEHTTVSQFMTDLQESTPKPPIFYGELYLEGHRGTLTQMHEIKRRNRRAEFALREAECLTVLAACKTDYADAPRHRAKLRRLWELLLVNQFHDILPGTSIAEVHDRAIQELGQVIEEARQLCAESAHCLVDPSRNHQITLFNSLNWPRHEAELVNFADHLEIDAPGVVSQPVTTPWGEKRLAVAGLDLPPLGAKSFTCRASKAPPDSPEPVDSIFEWDGRILRTPHLHVQFDEKGGLHSLVDVAAGRDLARPDQLPLNTFLFGEDVPAAWDNWDIDADIAMKLRPEVVLEQREIVADGPLQFRIRQHFRFGTGSTLVQDVVFHARSARIDFQTMMDWREKHRFLAVLFPLNLRAASARYEIQFGHLERPTHRNFAEDRERFEVCQHKWSNLSENRYGVALLNDGKYGALIDGGTIRLSLHKGGCHPDPRGDHGCHTCTYSLLPHSGGFQAETVVRPAYELNIVPTMVDRGIEAPMQSLFTVDAPNIIVESIKPAENGPGFVCRLYECERSATRACLKFRSAPAALEETNLLEEPLGKIELENGQAILHFRAFEIKTLRIT